MQVQQAIIYHAGHTNTQDCGEDKQGDSARPGMTSLPYVTEEILRTPYYEDNQPGQLRIDLLTSFQPR